jgi:hypothetical protein
LDCAGSKPTDDKVFSIGTHLDIHSEMVSSEVHLTGLRQVVTTTESKSVSLGVGSKPASKIFVYRSPEASLLYDHSLFIIKKNSHTCKDSLVYSDSRVHETEVFSDSGGSYFF